MKRILEIARGSRARIHVPVGIVNVLLIAACFCFAVMASCDTWASELPAGHTPNWSIEVFVWNPSAVTTFQLTDCRGFGPLPTYTIKPGGVVRTEPFTCFAGLGIVDAPAGAESASRMIFDNGVTHASFFVPALDRLTTATVTPIAVDMNVGTYANLYCDELTTITWTVFDGTETTSGYFYAPAGWSQYSIPVPVRAGSLKLAAGCVGFGPCPSHPFLGFASVGDVRGGNAIVLPLK